MPDLRKTETAVIIPAAGSGVRAGTSRPKQFVEIANVPILVRAIQPFLELNIAGPVIVALPLDRIETAREMFRACFSPADLARLILVAGGRTRQESVLAGIRALPPETVMVLIHDGARPFVNPELIRKCLDEAVLKGAAITAVPVRDTLKEVGPDKMIRRTVDRVNLWQAQTPQAARRELLERAYVLAGEKGFAGTDEASLLEHAGCPVAVVDGSEYNFKITRPEDLMIAAALLEENTPMKIGHGFDAHRFAPGRKLILGGAVIPFDLGLEGHSDADVPVHALMDALLGALGAGDIGSHFLESNPQYRNISSLLLLKQVMELVRNEGFAVVNADVTVICQQPRLAPYIDSMHENIAAACRIEKNAVNIKATTTEKMGFTGRGEGIASHAVVLLRKSHEAAMQEEGYTDAD